MRSLSKDDLPDEGMHQATIEIAEKHLQESVLRNDKGEYLPVCSTESSDLGSSSIGLELYFLFLKQMTSLLLLLSLLEIPQIVINYLGGYYSSSDTQTVFDRSTLGNQQGFVQNSSTSSLSVQTLNDYEYVTVFFDVGISALFVILVFACRWYNYKRVIKSKIENLSPANYAVEVLGLPETLGLGGREAVDTVKEFFQSKFGEVVECSFAHTFNGSLGLYKKMADFDKEIRKEQMRCQIIGKPTSVLLDQLQEKRAQAKEALRKALPDRDDYDHLPINRAYLIFNTIESKQNCMRAYQQCTFLGCCTCSCCLSNELCYPKSGVPYYTLQVRNAPNPSDILWENLEYSTLSKFFRGLLAFISVVLLLVLSYAAIYAIQVAQSFFPTVSDCSTTATISLSQALVETNSTKLNCFCSQIGVTTVIFMNIITFNRFFQTQHIIQLVQIIIRFILNIGHYIFSAL